MATTNDRSQIDATVRSAANWTRFLEDEAQRLSSLRLRAGILSIDIEPDDPDSVTVELARSRAMKLLQHALGSSEQHSVTAESKIAVLVAPVHSLAELYTRAWHLAGLLQRSGLDAAVGFAHRRRDETLLDTWARADAQADRIQFRKHRHSGGLSLL